MKRLLTLLLPVMLLAAEVCYPNPDSQDTQYIPKTVEENGRTMTLQDISWKTDNTGDMDGYDIGNRFTAVATYTGSATSSYVAGYTVTADYTGEVTKTSCEVVIYTAIFGCTDVPYVNTAPTQGDGDTDSPAGSNPPENNSQASGDTVTDTAAPSGGAAALSIAGCTGGIAALLAAAYWGFEKIKERRSAT